MATLKYLVYVGAGGFAPNFSINYFFKKILTESSRKRVQTGIRDRKFKACKVHGRDFTTVVKILNLQDLCVEPLNPDGLYEMFFQYKSL